MQFLNLFEQRFKGEVTNTFLHKIRSGLRDVEKIKEAVARDIVLRSNKKEWHNIVLKNLNNPDLDIFIHYYLKYNTLDLPEIKKLKNKKRTIKKYKNNLSFDIITQKRPLSWSSISSWEYSKSDWFNRYIEGKKTLPTREMIFGKTVGERIASDPLFLPSVPRLPIFERKFSAVYDGIPLIGYADSFCEKENKLLEFKTGKKDWTQERADKHGQIDMYLLMYNLETGIRPEDVHCCLVWLPTQELADMSIDFIRPVKRQIFETKRTMEDIEKFGERVKRVYKEMKVYVEKKLSPK